MRSGAGGVWYAHGPERRPAPRGLRLISANALYTQPVGFGRPAILQAPFAGPDGNNS